MPVQDMLSLGVCLPNQVRGERSPVMELSDHLDLSVSAG